MTAKKSEKFIPCRIARLPKRMIVPAAQYAVQINPANAPPMENFAGAVMAALTTLGTEGSLEAADVIRRDDGRDAGEGIASPLAIAMLSSKWWGTDGVDLSVSFMETTTAALQNKILGYMNVLAGRANVKFRLAASDGDVRISRGRGGYFSFLGPDILHISRDQQTMNLEAFTLKTPESEYARVVPHETFHTCGCPHEHMRPALVDLLDPDKTIAYFRRTQGWSAADVRQQVLTPLSERSLMGTPPDQDSIMCYTLPGSITKNGQPIRGGTQVNASDFEFMAKMYPLAVAPPPPPPVSATLTVNLDTKTVFLPAGWTSRPV